MHVFKHLMWRKIWKFEEKNLNLNMAKYNLGKDVTPWSLRCNRSAGTHPQYVRLVLRRRREGLWGCVRDPHGINQTGEIFRWSAWIDIRIARPLYSYSSFFPQFHSHDRGKTQVKSEQENGWIRTSCCCCSATLYRGIAVDDEPHHRFPFYNIFS